MSPFLSEFDLIQEFKRKASPNAQVVLGIGDDCASVRFTPGAEVLITTDMLMDGRHFRVDQDRIEDIGNKCLAVNLSDIAAMAGRPVAAVVAVALPRGHAANIGLGLIHGMIGLAAEFEVAIIGGDTNAWDGPLVVSITLFGEATGRGPVRRSGAKAGDAIFVTGGLGGSLASGRHLKPRPRIAEALALHRLVDLHAMIDVSDGLAGDLRHILDSSGGLGATLDVDSIPMNDGVEIVAALTDGEDFELCFTVSAEDATRLLDSPPTGVKIFMIGRIEAEPGLRLRHPDGRVIPCTARGFDHLGGSDR